MNEPLIKIEEAPDLLRPSEVANYLRISGITLKRWGKKGILNPIRINSRGDRRFFRKDIISFLGKKEHGQ